jgi:hypothetical protein
MQQCQLKMENGGIHEQNNEFDASKNFKFLLW